LRPFLGATDNKHASRTGLIPRFLPAKSCPGRKFRHGFALCRHSASYRPALVRAVFFAAVLLPSRAFVRTAFAAAPRRLLALRLLAAERVCFDKALRDAVVFGSFFSAFVVARDRFADTFFRACDWPFS
jgi:hypothetical protein